ncbi:MAG: hypothetical protein PHC88_05390 [Terrimicrobiaceae bacterium]|nr:hypothetical protein [Terrimicrobiaceae bacterium]
MNGNGTAMVRVRFLVAEFFKFATFNWRDEMPEGTANAWAEELADIPIALLETALKRARRQKFMPNVGDVREIAASLESTARALAQAHRSRALLERGDKPPDWEPLAAEEQAALFGKFKTVVAQTAAEKKIPKAPVDLEAQLRKLRKQAELLQRGPKPESEGEV